MITLVLLPLLGIQEISKKPGYVQGKATFKWTWEDSWGCVITHHPHALFHTLSFLFEPPIPFPSTLFADVLLPISLRNKSNQKSIQLPQALITSHMHSPTWICAHIFTFPLTVSELAVLPSKANHSPLAYSSSSLQGFFPLYGSFPEHKHAGFSPILMN